MNGKKVSVEKLDELDKETTNAMTADDFLKCCDDCKFERTYEAIDNEFVDIDFIEEELRKRIYIDTTNDIKKTNTNTTPVKPKNVNLRKSTRKK